MNFYEKAFRHLYVLEEKHISPTNMYAKVKISPYEKGQGMTVANVIRRVLLSQIDCLAFQSVQIDGVSHEFSIKPGLKESVSEILFNLSQVCLRQSFNYMNSNSVPGEFLDSTKQIQLGDFSWYYNWNSLVAFCKKTSPGTLFAKDISLPFGIECVDPNQKIATIVSPHIDFKMNIVLVRSKQYAHDLPHQNMFFPKKLLKQLNSNSNFNQNEDDEFEVFDSPFLPLDSSFSPIKRVNYTIKQENSDKQEAIFLEIWTNGSLHPIEAIAKVSLSIRQMFQPLTS